MLVHDRIPGLAHRRQHGIANTCDLFIGAGNDGLIAFITGVLMMIAGIMLHIKRCHDRGKSGWWCLLLLVPFVGLIWAIIDLGILPGTVGPNEYGPDPLGA